METNVSYLLLLLLLLPLGLPQANPAAARSLSSRVLKVKSEPGASYCCGPPRQFIHLTTVRVRMDHHQRLASTLKGRLGNLAAPALRCARRVSARNTSARGSFSPPNPASSPPRPTGWPIKPPASGDTKCILRAQVACLPACLLTDWPATERQAESPEAAKPTIMATLSANAHPVYSSPSSKLPRHWWRPNLA